MRPALGARVQSALSRATEASEDHDLGAPEPDAEPGRVLAVGDPQAPTETFLAILALHGLLGDDGWLRGDVRLVSIGDHFDYGPFEQREEAACSGLRTLSWLAAHPARQVGLIAGNHDLARVAELRAVDDVTFQRASCEAFELYHASSPDPEAETRFLERYPWLPSVEVAARDLSSFRVAQRDLVERVLKERRFRLAWSEFGLLLCHAGATSEDLSRAGLNQASHADSEAAAVALNRVFDAAIEDWGRSENGGARVPFEVNGFFRAGSAKRGEAGGFLYQRPWRGGAHAVPVPPKDRHRRFDPRQLPRGLTQVVGHVRDPKCRKLLGDWVDDTAPAEGGVRHLRTDGSWVSYAAGAGRAEEGEARMVFIDGGMNQTAEVRYELLDLRTCSPARAAPTPE